MRKPVLLAALITLALVPITALPVCAAVPVAAQNALPGLDNFTLERPRPPAPVATPLPTPSTSPTSMPVPGPTPTTVPAPRARPSATPSPTASPSATPSERATATSTPSATPTATPSSVPEPVAVPPAAVEPAPTMSESGAPDWAIWLVAALVVIAAVAAFLWWRGRPPQRRIAGLEASTPAASASAAISVDPARVPPAAPAPAKAPGGLVTVLLRPEIAIDLQPLAAGIDTLRATVEFGVTVRNTGRAPAHDVIVEAWLIGAGNDPRAELSPLLNGPPIAPLSPPFALPASATVDVAGQGLAARAALATITAGDRQSFVPLVGVRVSWHDAGGIVGVARAAFLIGAERADHARLAPLALDRGTRTWRTIAARRYEL